jgi:hypothetical protein
MSLTERDWQVYLLLTNWYLQVIARYNEKYNVHSSVDTKCRYNEIQFNERFSILRKDFSASNNTFSNAFISQYYEIWKKFLKQKMGERKLESRDDAEKLGLLLICLFRRFFVFKSFANFCKTFRISIQRHNFLGSAVFSLYTQLTLYRSRTTKFDTIRTFSILPPNGFFSPPATTFFAIIEQKALVHSFIYQYYWTTKYMGDIFLKTKIGKEN